MLKVTDQLFDEFVHFVTQHRSGERYTRDPHQAVPPDCGFVRFRTPGGMLFTSAGLVQFRTREEASRRARRLPRAVPPRWKSTDALLFLEEVPVSHGT